MSNFWHKERTESAGLDEQQSAPLFEALCAYVGQVRAPYHVPGHKMGRAAPEALQQWLGAGLSLDLTEAPGLDDLHAPTGAIAAAQELAARAFGARWSSFLVGGTTAGLHALILTACQPGQVIAVPRIAHRSILGALILSGAQPAWVEAEFEEGLGLPLGNDRRSLLKAVEKASAALLIHPTYHGLVGDLKAEIDVVHTAGIPVLVDEAHGSHFAFHPDLPPPSLSLGADGVAQSLHKTGGSLTQSSICHLGEGSRLDRNRLQEMLRLVQSTSPSYLLMASLDLARRDLALHGWERWAHTMELASQVRAQLALLQGIQVHPAADPTKLIIDVRGRGLTGFQAAECLWQQGVAVEFSGLGYLLAILSPGDSPESIQFLVSAVASLPTGSGVPSPPELPPWPEVVLSPRAAFLGQKESVSLAEARGRIAAELWAPYPPGIPVVAPGERLTADVLAYLSRSRVAGYHIQGPADPCCQSIQVVRE